MIESAVAFGLFAALLTITPGLDTVLVLRTAATDGRRQAYLAALGISCGLLFWALAGGLGITAVLAASQLLYDTLRIAGAIYLCWLGVSMLRRSTVEVEPKPLAGKSFRVGLTSNLANPKVGIFYVSVLPQFLPEGVNPLAASFGLAAIHVVEGLLWFALLITVVSRARDLLSRPKVRRICDRVTATVFVALGLRLAFDR